MAGRRGAAPRSLSFGDSTAQAGARPVLEIINRKSEIENVLVRLPRVALGHAPWRGAIRLLNHNRSAQVADDVRRLYICPGESEQVGKSERERRSCDVFLAF